VSARIRVNGGEWHEATGWWAVLDLAITVAFYYFLFVGVVAEVVGLVVLARWAI
jgi:hypothetical protein